MGICGTVLLFCLPICYRWVSKHVKATKRQFWFGVEMLTRTSLGTWHRLEIMQLIHTYQSIHISWVKFDHVPVVHSDTLPFAKLPRFSEDFDPTDLFLHGNSSQQSVSNMSARSASFSRVNESSVTSTIRDRYCMLAEIFWWSESSVPFSSWNGFSVLPVSASILLLVS